jgi:DNA-binding transcriptional MerR regulator
MNEPRNGLLAIGAFASAAQLSLKALRLYAQLGILTPSYVDPDSGYRHYRADQLPKARLIRALRQVDMPLATIRRVLEASPGDAEQLVLDHCQVLERRAIQARQAVSDILNQVRKETTTMAFDIEARTIDPQSIVSINKRVKVDQLEQHITSSLDALYALVEGQGVATTGAPFGIYHGPVNQEDDGPIEVCVPVGGNVLLQGAAQTRTLAGGEAATLMLEGPQCNFPAILKGYDAVYDWVSTNGYEATEPPREIWHSKPHEHPRMEVVLLFRPR